MVSDKENNMCTFKQFLEEQNLFEEDWTAGTVVRVKSMFFARRTISPTDHARGLTLPRREFEVGDLLVIDGWSSFEDEVYFDYFDESKRNRDGHYFIARWPTFERSVARDDKAWFDKLIDESAKSYPKYRVKEPLVATDWINDLKPLKSPHFNLRHRIPPGMDVHFWSDNGIEVRFGCNNDKYEIDRDEFYSKTCTKAEWNRRFLNSLTDEDLTEAVDPKKHYFATKQFSAYSLNHGYGRLVDIGDELALVTRDGKPGWSKSDKDHGVVRFLNFSLGSIQIVEIETFKDKTLEPGEWDRKFLTDLHDDDLTEAVEWTVYVCIKEFKADRADKAENDRRVLAGKPRRSILDLPRTFHEGQLCQFVKDDGTNVTFGYSSNRFIVPRDIFWDSVVTEEEYGRRFLNGLIDE